MTTATNEAELIYTRFMPGDLVFTREIQQLMELRGACGKTARNRLADKLVAAGLVTRLKRGQYVVNNPPPLFCLGDTSIRRRADIGGSRSRTPKTHAVRRDALRAMHLDGLWKASMGICAHCGGEMLHHIHADLDHVQALAAHGEDAITNAVLVHHACNLRKGIATRADAMDRLDELGALVSRGAADDSYQRQLAYGAEVPPSYMGK